MNTRSNVRVINSGRSTRSTFTKEAQRIQARALRDETAVVRLGPILFFCANQDAWMLDPEDGFARCLVRDGQKLPHGITETKERFQAEWNADYQIQGETFTWVDRGARTVRTIIGYPTEQLAQFL